MAEVNAVYQARYRARVKEDTGMMPSRVSLLKKFGFTPETWRERTKNGCDICGAETNPDGTDLTLDHDHETDEFRGALCRSCNAAIGLLGDTLEGVERAFMYLLEAAHGE